MYLIQIGPVVYERRGGETFTLVEAVHEVAGVGAARILRQDGTEVLRHAGSTVAPWLHVPSGRTIHHRKARGHWSAT